MNNCPYYDTKECGENCIAQDHMEYLCIWAMMMVINQYGLRIEQEKNYEKNMGFSNRVFNVLGFYYHRWNLYGDSLHS